MTDSEKIEQIKIILEKYHQNGGGHTTLQAIKSVAWDLRDLSKQERHLLWPTIHREYKIEFDGGTPCNIPRLGYGIGYGSYRINGGEIVRCDHKIPMSANAAEIMTLIEAVRAVCRIEPNRSIIALDIWGDSEIAVRWAVGFSKKGKPCQISKGSSLEFRNVVQTLRDILKLFGHISANWHSRTNSVKTFGH